MSAYGGYTKTSYGAQGGDDSGGFFTGSSQQGSQGGGSGGKSYENNTLRPVTIKQINDAEEAYAGADFKIDGSPITNITFVGQLRSINPQQTVLTLKIDDGTGQVEVKKFTDSDKQDQAEEQFELDSHVRVWGRLKSLGSKRHVSALVVRPIENFDEVNYHMLEATYVHLYFSKGPLGQDGAPANANANGESMFVDGGAGYGNDGAGGDPTNSKLSGSSPAARKIFNFINNTPGGGNEGIHINMISTSTGMSVRDVQAAADELLGQGLIYSPVDDETWAILEY